MVTAKSMMTFKWCPGCEAEHPLSHFQSRGTRINSGGAVTPRKTKFCKDCLSKKQATQIFKKKAIDWIRRHANKLNVSVEQFHEWGLTTNYIEWLLMREWTLYLAGFHYCPNCYPSSEDIKKRKCFVHTISDVNGNTIEVPAVPGDLSIDIIDIDRFRRTGILTRSNVRVICNTANNAKGSKDPTQHDIEVEQYNRDAQAIKRGLQIGLNNIPRTKEKETPELQPTLF